MIRFILFDLAEVCIRGLPGVEPYIAETCGRDEFEIARHIRGDKLCEFFRGRISEEEYWNLVREEGNYQEPVSFFMNVVREYFLNEIPGTIEIIRELESKGYKIGLISDHAREWIEFVELKFDFFSLFDFKGYSFDAGLIKLEKGFFDYVLSEFGAYPEETLFIDDVESNLETAKTVGIKYLHHFTNADNLRQYLVEEGVLDGD